MGDFSFEKVSNFTSIGNFYWDESIFMVMGVVQ